ncbi:alpha/beta hydrolase [Dactylosporangium sp. CA-152071]|uniref:alpha/beta hydrolase n=1 Tax=Dactylosporangium sp. CA-152071 TaxID=3239933 RepID=UPI003D8AE291
MHRRTFSLLVVVLTTLCSTLVGPAAHAGTAGFDRYRGQRLNWGECVGAPTPGLQCAAVTLPRDWRRPGFGADMQMEISRLRAGDPAGRRGVLLLTSGGGGGTFLPTQYSALGPLAATYDLIGFDMRHDPRTPLDCQNRAEYEASLRIDVLDRSKQNIQAMLDYSRGIAEACLRRSGDQIRYINTEQVVNDMDLVRQLLREQKISYLGVSAGPWLGAHYATRFPQRVDRFLFDGSVDFATTWYHAFNLAPGAFEERFVDFLGWLATHDGHFGYGATAGAARSRWEARRADLVSHPLRISDTFTLTAGNLDNGTIGSLYVSAQFPDLGRALAAIERLDTATDADKAVIERVFGPSPYFSPGPLAAFYSLMCNDTPWPRGGQHYVELSDRLGARYPFMGYGWLLQPCAYWPFPPNATRPVDGGIPATILMVNSAHDPSTPYPGALDAHRLLKRSRMVTVTGNGDHGQFGVGNRCVDDIGLRFLVEGVAPRTDTTCQGLPLPGPTGPATA